jgi:SAM-dependent methyltransferase
MDRRAILRRLASGSATQPATMFWRAFEIETFAAQAPLAGRGIDLGCGDGQFTAALFRELGSRPTLVGVEPGARDASLARRAGVYTEVHCTTGDRVPEPDESLDFVMSNNVLEHIEDLPPVLREVARMLRPEGSFAFAVPSDEFHSCLRGSALLDAIARARGSDYHRRLDERMSHVRYASPQEWTDALAGAGLRVARMHRYMPVRAVRLWERLSNLTGGLAFELFGGRRTPREIQHGLGIARSLPGPIAAGIARGIEVVAGDVLDAQIASGEPSGGLLVVALRPRQSGASEIPRSV